jgi:hypothetical protein
VDIGSGSGIPTESKRGREMSEDILSVSIVPFECWEILSPEKPVSREGKTQSKEPGDALHQGCNFEIYSLPESEVICQPKNYK